MPTTFTEGIHDSEGIISEANGNRSRENLTLEADGSVERALKAMTPLGRKHGSVTATAFAGNTGNGTMAATPTVGAGAKPGTYKLTVIEPGTDAGDFVVEDPDGEQIGTGAIGAAFSAGGLSFTLQDGATDFAAGDGFDIAVALDAGGWVAFNQDGTDGSEHARAVLLNAVTVPIGVDTPGACVVRDCELKDSELNWPSDIDAGEKVAAIAQLAELGIIVRTNAV